VPRQKFHGMTLFSSNAAFCRYRYGPSKLLCAEMQMCSLGLDESLTESESVARVVPSLTMIGNIAVLSVPRFSIPAVFAARAACR
jgi:hypothetical protein